MNLFENAARGKYRFPSIKGEITVEQLFDLPLQSRSGFDLDSVAKAMNAELKATVEESFVQMINPRKTELDEKFELVKHVIKTRLDENAARAAAANRQQEIRKFEELLERKKDQALDGLSPEEIETKLAALRGA